MNNKTYINIIYSYRMVMSNCSTSIQCTIVYPGLISVTYIYCVAMLVFSIIGILCNLTAILIFNSADNMTTKFFSFMKIYTINSLLVNLLDLMYFIFYFTGNDDVFANFAFYHNLTYQRKESRVVYSHVYRAVWSII